MPRRSTVWALFYLTVVAAACDRQEAPEDPASEMVERVEGVDPEVMAALAPEIPPELLALGREQYVVCSVCHGLDARGTQLGPSLRGPEWIHIDGSSEQLIEIIRTGVPNPAEYPIPMPVMGGGDFDEEELRALAAYLHAVGQSQ
jgi:mono/diheme cytochrome c family protein